MEEGYKLSSIERLVSQRRIEQYAGASGDFNPIHVDPDFAATSQFGTTIAHGMMVAATISEMMTAEFRADWPSTGRLKIRFRAPVLSGETVTAHGVVSRVRRRDEGLEIVCSVGVNKQDGQAAITGEATVLIPADVGLGARG